MSKDIRIEEAISDIRQAVTEWDNNADWFEFDEKVRTTLTTHTEAIQREEREQKRMLVQDIFNKSIRVSDEDGDSYEEVVLVSDINELIGEYDLRSRRVNHTTPLSDNEKEV